VATDPQKKPDDAKPQPASGAVPKSIPAKPSTTSASKAPPRAATAIVPPKPTSARPAAAKPTEREALGLSAAKPSEMVAGLDQIVARAEKMEAREQQKKKAGGNTLNTALHVDDTGQRWKRQIILAIVAVILIGGFVFAFLIYRANKKELTPREGNEIARLSIEDLRTLAGKYPFPENETVTLETAKAKLSKAIDEELTRINDLIAKETETTRPVDRRAVEMRDRLNALKEFKDPWGQPFEMELSPEGSLIVTVPGKPYADGSRMKPFEITLKAGKRR
jgi:hypothetical protein